MPEYPQKLDTLPANFPAIRANFDAQVTHKLNMQSLEWLYWIPISKTVPAGAGADGDVDIKKDAHFECHYITGSFTTLDGDEDVGVDQMTVRFSDQSNDLKLGNSAIPLNLFLSPGRVLSPGTAGNPSNQLFYPMPFYHTFAANGGILAEFQNAGSNDNQVDLLMMGRKLRASLNDVK